MSLGFWDIHHEPSKLRGQTTREDTPSLWNILQGGLLCEHVYVYVYVDVDV